MAPRMASYRPHSRKNEHTAPSRPRMKPSTTNGIRMNEFVAPTIFMIAISSLREYIANLTVFEMISSDTTNSTAMITADAMFSTFWHRLEAVDDLIRRIHVRHAVDRADLRLGLLHQAVVLQRDDIAVAERRGVQTVEHRVAVHFFDKTVERFVARDIFGLSGCWEMRFS